MADKTRHIKSLEELEKEKLEAEIYQIKKPLYKKASFLVPLSILVVTVITTIEADRRGYLDFQLKKIKFENDKLEKRKEILTWENRKLEERKQILELENQKIQIESDSLKTVLDSLAPKLVELSKKINLQIDELRIQREAILGLRADKDIMGKNLRKTSSDLDSVVNLYRLVHKPILSFRHESKVYTDEKQVYIEIKNQGPSTAVINYISAYYKDSLYVLNNISNGRRFLRRIGLAKTYIYITSVGVRDYLSPNGGVLRLLEITKGNINDERRHLFFKALEEVTFLICYSSILGDYADQRMWQGDSRYELTRIPDCIPSATPEDLITLLNNDG